MTTKQQGMIQQQAAKPAKKQPEKMQDYVAIYRKAIEKAPPKLVTPERFIRTIHTALTNTPKLQTCTPESFIGAMLNCAELGLEPNTPLGLTYIIPYGNQATFQIGYKGILELAYRSGKIKSVQAHAVHEIDLFECEYGFEEKLRHIPAEGDRGPVTKYYAYYITKDGGRGVAQMTIEDARAHRDAYSKAAKNGPWVTNFDEMAKKTVIRKALKYAPLSAEVAQAISSDESVVDIDLSSDAPALTPKMLYVDPDTGEVIDDAPAANTQE